MCDRDNIDSLATALADLVNGADDGSGDSAGGNFQVQNENSKYNQ